jgi:hypothetical protein
MLILTGKIGRRLLNGKKGVLKNSTLPWKDAKPDGTIIGDFT